ncbi:MAG: ABC transporter substrate binding protein [Thermodesulfovibrionales bacterium]
MSHGADRRPFALAALLVAAAFLCLAPAAPAGQANLLVVVSHDLDAYEDIIAGLRAQMGGLRSDARFTLLRLRGDEGRAERAMEAMRKERASLVFTIGTLATRAVLREVRDTPVIACGVMGRDGVDGAPNAADVAIEIPVATQFRYLRDILPEARRVGVIYNPEENEATVKEARRTARDMGLQLVEFPASQPQDLPMALQGLANRVDVFWALPDSLVFSPQTAREILLFTFRNRIPFVGLSSPWVKAGALYALEWDYFDLGGRCAGLAARVMGGEPVASLSPGPPGRVLYSINLKTAEHLKLDIPRKVLDGAHSVY